MHKRKIFIVFDQLPDKEKGGLVYTYTQFISLLSDEYDIEIISVFDSGFDTFHGCKVRNLIPYKTNVVVSDFKKYIKEGKYGSALNIPFSAGLYFALEPVAKKRVKKVLDQYADKIVIAVSPAAATFIPSGTPFILEFHIKYEYFFEGGVIQKLQVKLMSKPSLILFRTQRDMLKASSYYNSGYIYNFLYNNYSQKKKIGEKSRQRKILFMGRLEDAKDPMRLLRNAKELKKRVGDFQLDIYGSGSMKEEMNNYIKANGLSNCVCLKGFTDNKEVYNDYSLLWMTSKYEGFPVVTIEAKANGVPTVSTNWNGGIREVIHNGQDGYIVDTDKEFIDCTVQLLENQEMLNEFSKKALKDFDRFNADTAKKRWTKILEDFSKKQNKR